MAEGHTRVMIPSRPSIQSTCDHPITLDVEEVEPDLVFPAFQTQLNLEVKQVSGYGYALVPHYRPDRIVRETPHLASIVIGSSLVCLTPRRDYHPLAVTDIA